MSFATALTPPPHRGDQARARLLCAALEIFGERGPDGATVREIARAAGQNVAAIAYYFGGKQQLYHAVIEGLVREIRSRLDDVYQRVEQLRRQDGPTPEAALPLVKEFLGAVYLRLLSRKEAVHIAQLIVREQLKPTAAFEILYGQGFRHLHEALSFLVGVVLGREATDRETILRTHMLMGQIYFFAMSREVILRRLGWTTLEGRNAELVVKTLGENIDTLLSGRAQRPRERPRASRPGVRDQEPGRAGKAHARAKAKARSRSRTAKSSQT